MKSQTKGTKELKPHPLNDEIYGDRADSDLVESVRKRGIYNPLLITYDNRIISGHRRWSAASAAGLLDVPVVIFDSEDELDIQEAIIESNRQREKTNEQIGREYSHLKRIINERESRQGNRNDLTSGSREPEVPPIEKAAKLLAVSKSTAIRAENVVNRIDELNKNGKVKEATKLKEVLNKSVNKAYKAVKAEEPKDPPKPSQNYITLTQWNNNERNVSNKTTSGMNRVNENIEWAAFSWNPITGCLHNCNYCYARDLANRFYPQKFEPSFIPERLTQPENTKPIPPRWENDTGHKNVFTCSMADLFGKWVPAEWIEAVIETIKKNPQWTFLLLTKFPVRMAEFNYPDNVWLGTSVDYQWAVDRAEKAFTKIKSSGFNGICWLSCEPMMERLTFNSLSMFDWIAIGGSSKSTQTPEYKPPFDDIVHLHIQAREAGCKIYHKTNLIERLREYPK